MTALPPGSYTYSIQSSTGDTIWDLNDYIQVTVIEMDHAGIGGGM